MAFRGLKITWVHRNLLTRSSIVFFLWTLTSFVCHQSAKSFLRNGSTYLQDQDLLLSIILTLAQSLACSSLVDIQHQKDKLFYIMAVSHMVATFATNCSMAFMSASSTFAIKLMEPITSAVFQRLVLSTSLSTSTLISLPLIISGAVVFAGNPLATTSLSIGVLMAFASNVILAVRNITMKIRQTESMELKLFKIRYKPGVVGFAAGFITTACILTYANIIPKSAIMITGMLFTSSLFHVAYSYVSTNIVLRYMTVVSHAVSNILKRLVVVMLLYIFGHRHATAWNFVGLSVCTMGLLIYIRGKVATINEKNQKISVDSSKILHNICKKLFPIILVVSVIAVVGKFGVTTVTIRKMEKYVMNNLPKTEGSGSTKEFTGKTFTSDSFKLPRQTELFPNLNANYLAQNKSKIEEFLKWRLLDHKHNVNLLSQLLPTNIEIAREAQRIHFNIFGDLIGKFKYAMLFDVAAFENKGDSAISAGEVYLLRRLGIKVIFYCICSECNDQKLQEHAQYMSKQYSKEELVILFHGGGNLIGYPFNDALRGKLFPRFKGFKMVIFPQSVFVRGNNFSGRHFDYCQRIYCCNPNLTIVLRDKQSLQIALKYWNNGTNFVMAPDMAFQIGPVHRFMSPSYDIVYLKRYDDEAAKGATKDMFPKNLTIAHNDWWGWITNKGSSSIESSFLIGTNGLLFLQRGRVIVTDRLHGHILGTLLNIPQVLVDNQYKKLSSYHNTWTKGLENVLITDNVTTAFQLALTLFETYKDKLPPIAPLMDVKEYPVPPAKKTK